MPSVINDAALLVSPANLYLFLKGRASVSTAAGANKDITLRATDSYLGVIGNDITLTILAGSGTVALSVAVTAGTKNIIVTPASTASTITSTADQVIAAINASAASDLVTATRLTGQTGVGVVAAQASLPLASGSDTETETFLGALLGEIVLSSRTDAVPVFAAQTGTTPRNKFISGGEAQLTFTMAEITFDRFNQAVANARLFTQSATVRRLDVGPRVGQSMRALAVKMKIVPIVGGVETTEVDRIITIPLAAPIDGDFPFRFVADAQQGIATVYGLWPDSTTNRLYFLGTETV